MLQLDTCCTASFVFNDIAATFRVKGMSTQLMVKTVNGTKSLDIKDLNGLFSRYGLEMRESRAAADELSTPKNVPTPALAYRWKHLGQTHASTVT